MLKKFGDRETRLPTLGKYLMTKSGRLRLS
jgi:hypothetical protein